MLGAHKARFVSAMFDAAVLLKALKDVMKVPVVDEQFAATGSSEVVGGAARRRWTAPHELLRPEVGF
ncbi:hypothetical protein [Deinococcus marmoris]|uniref:hypothetical protein n=1 Tax=Deinococcus marmoris TaxID=249408 RepID=UPI000496484C|nr:hypothetical protein [Deinococcus marmoris]